MTCVQMVDADGGEALFYRLTPAELAVTLGTLGAWWCFGSVHKIDQHDVLRVALQAAPSRSLEAP